VAVSWGFQAIAEILKTLEVNSWEELPGQFVRAENQGAGMPCSKIGHLIKDQWFSFDEFFGQCRERELDKNSGKFCFVIPYHGLFYGILCIRHAYGPAPSACSMHTDYYNACDGYNHLRRDYYYNNYLGVILVTAVFVLGYAFGTQGSLVQIQSSRPFYV
jgi:hypothetical protein